MKFQTLFRQVYLVTAVICGPWGFAHAQDDQVVADKPKIEVTGGYAVSVGSSGAGMTGDQKEELYLDGVVTDSEGRVWNFRLIPGEDNIRAMAIKGWQRAGESFVALTDPAFYETFAQPLISKGGDWIVDGTKVMFQDGVLFIVTDAIWEEALKNNVVDLAGWFRPFGEFKTALSDNPFVSIPKLVLWDFLVAGTFNTAANLVGNTFRFVGNCVSGLFSFVFGTCETTAGVAVGTVGLAGATIEVSVKAVWEVASALYNSIVLGTVIGGTPDRTLVPGVLYLWNMLNWAVVAGAGKVPSEGSFFVKLGVIKLDNHDLRLETHLTREVFAAIYQLAFVQGLAEDVRGDKLREIRSSILESLLEEPIVDEKYIRDLTAQVATSVKVVANSETVWNQFKLHIATVVNASKKNNK